MNGERSWVTNERIAWGITLAFSLVLTLLELPEALRIRNAINAVLWVVPIAGVLLSFANERLQRLSWFTDFRLAFLCAFFSFQVVLLLITCKWLVEPRTADKFSDARLEWFLVLVSIIGVIGAIWAILAKVDARRAFDTAELALKASTEAVDYSRKAYESVATSFQFEALFNQNADCMLPYHLERARRVGGDLILFLGFPAVGFFKKELRSESLQLLSLITQTVLAIRARSSGETCVLKLVCFSEELSQAFLAEAKSENTLTDEDIKLFTDHAKGFYAELEAVTKNGGDSRIDFLDDGKSDPGIRFAITKNTRDGYGEKGVCWIVSGFRLGSKENLKDFMSAGFKTRDEEVTKVLRQLCEQNITQLQGAVAP